MNMDEIRKNTGNDMGEIPDEKVNKDESVSAEDVLGASVTPEQPAGKEAEPEADIEVMDTLLMEDEVTSDEEKVSSDDEEAASDEEKVSSDQEEISSDEEEVTSAETEDSSMEEKEMSPLEEELSLEDEISRSLKELAQETTEAAEEEIQAVEDLEAVAAEDEKETRDMTDYDLGSLNEPKKKRRKIWFGAGGMVALLLIVYLGGAFFFQNHFVFGTVVNGMKVTGRTVEQVEEDMAAEVADYTLTLEQRGDVTEAIHASEIALEFISDGEVQKLLDSQNAFEWPAALFRNEDADLQATVAYDEEKLAAVFQELDLLDSDKVTEPVDAYPEYSESEGAYVIVEEVYGNLVREEELYALLDPAIMSGETSISLDQENCYVDPEYTAESVEVVNATEVLNTYVSSEITYEFGDDTEYLGSDEINKWLTVSEDWEVEIDEELVREFVDYIGSTYNTIGKTRNFTTTGGDTIQITSGDYGWNLKRDAETEELIEAIKEGYQGVKEPNYHRTAAQYGEQDWGDTYVEISIDQQRMWFYKDGKLLVDTPVVTGDVVRTYQGRSRATPTGIFMITYVDEDATLTGETYSNPVKYWMPFYYNVGIHDASWRSSFGGEIYKGNGSHGCINTPEAAAKTIHDNIEAWDPVIVY